ncbi:hypothetical protein ACOL23_12640, partial [Aliarcobacter butzleri]
IYFSEIENYIKVKILVKRIKLSSFKTFLSSIKSFISWSLANPSSSNEPLVYYLAKYLSDCDNGFEAYDSTFIRDLSQA